MKIIEIALFIFTIVLCIFIIIGIPYLLWILWDYKKLTKEYYKEKAKFDAIIKKLR